jgi:transcriptional regulator with XRE-family HTH domain
MTAQAKSATTPEYTSFDVYLTESLQDPRVRAAFEDARDMHTVLDRLIGFRRALRLSQTEVARRMGVKQPAVSGFETESSDPRLSTLQRYARAVEARLLLKLHWDAECDWVRTRQSVYAHSVEEAPKRTKPHPDALVRELSRTRATRSDFHTVA